MTYPVYLTTKKYLGWWCISNSDSDKSECEWEEGLEVLVSLYF